MILYDFLGEYSDFVYFLKEYSDFVYFLKEYSDYSMICFGE